MKENRAYDSRLPQWLHLAAYPLFFLSLVGIDLALRGMYGYIGGKGAFDTVPLLFTLGWALILTAVAALLPRLAARIFMAVLTVLNGVLAVTHAVMYNLFGSFFSFSDMQYAGDGAKFFSMTYLQVRKLLVVCVLLAVAATVAAILLLPRHKYRPRRFVAAGAALAAGVALVCIVHATQLTDLETGQTMTWSVAMEEDAAAHEKLLYTENQNPNMCLPLSGLYQYTCRNLLRTLNLNFGQNRQEKEQMNDYFARRQVSGENEMTGCLKGKNLIMIMAESLDGCFISPEYTPNIYALQQNSVNFVHNYTPLYLSAGTFSTEFVSQTGMIPPQSGISTDTYVENDFSQSLANLFRAQGYTANSFHSASPTIYNRGQIHKNLGFEAYYSHTEMGMDDYMLDSQLIRGFDRMTADAPFYSFVITYSGHGPYDDTMANISDPHLAAAEAAVAASGVTGSEKNMKEYTLAVAHMMETDAFIGLLMDELTDSGLLEDTVILLFADHYGKYMTDTDFLMELKGVDQRNLLCNTPMMLYSTDLAPRTVEKYTSSVDIFPTVCNLFGLDADLTRFVGDDAFGELGGVVYWRDGSWYDGSFYYDPAAGRSLTQAQADCCAQVKEKLAVSSACLKYNYFAER